MGLHFSLKFETTYPMAHGQSWQFFRSILSVFHSFHKITRPFFTSPSYHPRKTSTSTSHDSQLFSTYTPENQHGTWKCWFPIGISFSKGPPFSGSMLVLGDVKINFSTKLSSRHRASANAASARGAVIQIPWSPEGLMGETFQCYATFWTNHR